MAEEALKKLEDQLSCPICLDTYTDPKQLNCNHVFCRKCLVKLVIRDQQGQLVLTCPNCRQPTPVPDSGVAGLQAAFQINQFLEIVEEHKAKAKAATTNEEQVECASASPTPHRNITVVCPEHGRREVDLYCETCEETICYKCIMKDEKHHSHNYEELNKAFDKYKGELMSSLEPMEEQLATIKGALAALDAHCEETSNQRETVEASIHSTIEKLHHTLDVRKTELIDQLHRLTQAKLKSLAAQRDQIEITQARLSSCLHFMRENLITGNQGEALMMKSTTVRQVKELTTTFQPDMLEPITKADMIFSALADITAMIQSYGRVYEKSSPDPSKYTATGKGIEMALVGKKSTVLLQTLTFDNQPTNEAVNSIMCELVAEMTGTRVAASSIERKGQNHYEISYQATIKGKQKLHIEVEGQHIQGSPFPVIVRSPVEKLGTPILTIGEVRRPVGVAVNQRREVVVVEGDGHCISVFSPSGEKLRSFSTQDSNQEPKDPSGVAVDSKGFILLANEENHCIEKLTAEGELIKEVMGAGFSGGLQFHHFSGIVYNASNDKVYVGDGWNNRVIILNSDLKYFYAFGKAGSGKGKFDSIQQLACDSLSGDIYVLDFINFGKKCYHRIQVASQLQGSS